MVSNMSFFIQSLGERCNMTDNSMNVLQIACIPDLSILELRESLCYFLYVVLINAHYNYLYPQFSCSDVFYFSKTHFLRLQRMNEMNISYRYILKNHLDLQSSVKCVMSFFTTHSQIYQYHTYDISMIHSMRLN